MSFLTPVFDVVVAVALVILTVAAHFNTSQILGYVYDLYGETAPDVAAGVDIFSGWYSSYWKDTVD